MKLSSAFVFLSLFATVVFATAAPAAIEAEPIHAVESYSAAHPKPVTNTDENNLRFYPGDLLLGGMRLDWLSAGSGSWAVGPTVQYINENIVLTSATYWGAGITSTYTFGRPAFASGWYLSPEAIYRSGQVAVDDITAKYSGNFRALTATLTAGYHWYWRSFNLALGMGASWSYVQVSNVTGTFHDLFGANGGSDTTTTNPDTVSATGFGLAADLILGFTF